MVVDDAPDHNLSLWDWQRGDKGFKITETKCSSDLVVGVEFHPMERHWFVTCGKSHICFWSLEQGSMARKLGLFESRDKPKYVTCLAFADNGDVLSGDSSGNILVWSKGPSPPPALDHFRSGSTKMPWKVLIDTSATSWSIALLRLSLRLVTTAFSWPNAGSSIILVRP